MPRRKYPHLLQETTRHQTTVWYVRVGKGPRTRIHGAYESPEFMAEYHRAIVGAPAVAAQATAKSESLRWLWDRYRETTRWSDLAQATRKQRESIMHGVLDKAGDDPFLGIDRETIEDSIAARRDTPAQARNFLKLMRHFFCWAKKAKHVAADPTEDVKAPTLKASDGFPAWTEEDIAAYETKWPRGTRQRVWLDVIQYTGLRRGDAVRVGRQHVKDGIIYIKTEKSRFELEVAIPLLPPLAETLKAGPTGDLAFICGASGEPFTKESFGNNFRDAARAAGVNKSAHGIRKAAATIAAENGATVAELDAIFGWTGGKMAALYTKAADRRRLAKAAAKKLQRDANPAPKIPVRGSGEIG